MMELCSWLIRWNLTVKQMLAHICCIVRVKIIKQNREQRYTKYTANRHYTKNKGGSQDSFRNSGHLAKRRTSAYRECVFFWAAAVYLSSICQERAAACRRCSHRLCLVNSTSDIHETAEGCRSTEIDFCFCFFWSLRPPPPFSNNKAPLYQNRNGCTLKYEPYIEVL